MSSLYWDFIRIRFLTMLAYRVNYYSGILVYTLNIGVYYFTWQAIYGGKEQIAGFTAAQMTTYVAVSWMARSFYFNNLDREIATEIRDGTIAIQFIRPYNYLMVKMMQGFGEGLFRFLLFMIPGMLIALLLFPVQLPTSITSWIGFLIMLFFSFLINSQINIIIGMLAFFVENNEGMMRMKRIVVDLFSGLLIPISFFPGWLVSIMNFLPFQAITYLPGSVFTGRVKGTGILEVLGIQVVWFVLLLIPIYFIWRAARVRLFVQGG
ncbi:ABC-2 family transporter protein [Paenibacillus sp. PsM32]|uniref:ABC transporter permease n=2 Tax=Paenibacillus TaxID=44249 RepID=A0ABW4UNW4_9BACL|nr:MULTISPECIES: ABC-2 family transporter protein [Paenibacillus]MDN4619303.1 ABC-2 family transporter protein [Paenibacillus sp. PsM32]MDQ1237162.1 ABC-2 type transport system permease protein [Paenibacillus sp. SORGH_AS_0306]MDR6109521.1 ABC-2 type transport system permease protein [Paenibacillus sp. SORGH_AS_0338]WCT56522.1 ABC-2 family transporter protein [Paenibacillus kyungheensis]WDF50370.1 ABC-2 family transporter protein [Paenibacillus sp. KACC 21273]